MKRTAGVCVGVLLLVVAVPAWATHSTPEGINCSNFTFQEDAQDYFNAHPGDPEGLDGPPGPTPSGIPNVACEDLPPRPTTTTITTATTTPSSTTSTTVTTLVTTTTTVPIAQGFLERTG